MKKKVFEGCLEKSFLGKKRVLLVVFIVLFVISSLSFGADRGDFFVGGMYGGGRYNKEGEDDSNYAGGLFGNFYLSEPLSLEGIVAYMPVWNDDYYFVLFGLRYDFLKVDFFMTPSVAMHGGILTPVGEKNDIDGVMSISAMLMYKTKWGFEVGPQMLGSAIFEGPHISAWVNYTGAIRIRF